jgi:hypothetical protein
MTLDQPFLNASARGGSCQTDGGNERAQEVHQQFRPLGSAITALQHFSESVRYNLQRLRIKRLNQLKECKTGHCN